MSGPNVVIGHPEGSTNVDSYYAGLGHLSVGAYDTTYLATNVTFTAVILILTEVGYQYQWWAIVAPVAWGIGMLAVRWLFIRKV